MENRYSSLFFNVGALSMSFPRLKRGKTFLPCDKKATNSPDERVSVLFLWLYRGNSTMLARHITKSVQRVGVGVIFVLVYIGEKT